MVLWLGYVRRRNHYRITLAVCKFYGLSNAHEIAKASTVLDKEPDYYMVYRKGRIRKRVLRHHNDMAIKYAFKHLMNARKRYLTGLPYVKPLGKALHYLQDYSIDPREKVWIFKYRSKKLHKSIEADLGSIPVDLKAAEEALKTRCYPHEFMEKVRNIGRGRTPEEVMRISCYLTSLALKLVLNPDEPEYKEGVDREWFEPPCPSEAERLMKKDKDTIVDWSLILIGLSICFLIWIILAIILLNCG